MIKEKLLEIIREMMAENWADSDLDARTEKILAFIVENDYEGREEDLEAFIDRINSARTETPALFIVQDALKNKGWNFEKSHVKGGGEMTGQIYKIITVNGKQVKCIDQIDGFSLEIDGSRYHVYADEDGSTHVDLVIDDDKCFFNEREYIGKIDDGTADEEKAALFILSWKD